jgi:conjugative relaxase-like TrwC/TraI family protein
VVAVISIKMLRAGTGRAAYYLDRAADCHPSGYYLEPVETTGRWCGHGATALGLAGQVTGAGRDGFARLLDGRLPDGTVVAGPVLRQDPNGPEGARVDIRQCGMDLAISPPKSVSVLYALADPGVSASVVAAHEAAVNQALAYLERHAGHGLRGHQGHGKRATRIETNGLIAAAFTHHTSRADDPQLHTHLVIANLLHGVDGKWSAVDSRAMHLHARTAGCIYQAALRGELTTHLGVRWSPVQRGVAEIVGIGNPLRKEFSSRRQAIEDELERTGTAGRKAAQRAAYVTRPTKTHTPVTSLREEWADRAAAMGQPAEQVIGRTLGQVTAPAWPEFEVVAAEMFGPGGLTKQATSFDRRDVIQALTETLPVGLPVTAAHLEAAVDELLADAETVPLVSPATRNGERRWSTRELLETEQRALAISGARSQVPAMTLTAAGLAVSRRTLSAEQRTVVTGLLTSSDMVDVVIGPAGSGKTAALRAATDAWHAHRIPVIGCSLAAVTARRLETATGVPCASITRTLADLDRIDPATGQPAGLAPRSVVLVDEASMVGTRQYLRLATHVHVAGGKLVLVGDPAQLAEIDAGGIFTALARDREPLSLTGNQRQTNPWERDALVALRDGEPDTALGLYLAHDRVHVHVAPSRVCRQLAADYVTHRTQLHDPYAVIALASTRRDVTRLNQTIRDRLRATGELGADEVHVPGEHHDHRYTTGDLVIVTRNDHRAGLLNGTRATITTADRQHLTLRTETGEKVTVPTMWAGEHLDHGYAMTVHKAQGLTTQVALLYGTAALCQQAGYVAMSRGRDANHLYTTPIDLHPDNTGLELDTTPGQVRATPDDVLRSLAAHLSYDRGHTLATDQSPAYPRESIDWPYPHMEREAGRERGRSR